MGAHGRPDEKETVDISMPSSPDPFWPSGVAPRHLSKELMKDSKLVASFVEITGPIWHCEKCGATTEQSQSDKRYCRSCQLTQAQNSALAKKTNSNWMDESLELGLSVFERQPEETDLEWRIWCKYRDYYPRKLPTWTELAAACESTVVTVTKAAAKWSYKVRLLAWSRYTDEGIQERRIDAIREMNTRQLNMSQTIQKKLETAISLIVPETLRPGEIVNLFKIATELERKVTTYVEEHVETESSGNRSKQVSLTKAEDLSEVVAILQKTGVLDGKMLGIEQTTRIVVKEDE